MKVSVDISDSFHVTADLKTAFALLSDVPRSVSHFPDMQKLQDEGKGRYCWYLKPLGAAGISHQVIYACIYVADDNKMTVTWTPVAGVGNGVIQGQWRLKAQGQGTAIEFETSGELDVPVPMLLRAAAKPVIQGLFQSQVRGYLKNIRATLGQ
jgi:carbon monoxide dehydrogenase subunit G